MGSECSTAIVRPAETCGTRSCGPLQGGECGDDSCNLCDDDRDRDDGPFRSAEHPLLQETLAGGPQQPPSPRGPAPPWATSFASSREPIDRTATGATPPRSPTPPRLTPPGLPDEEAVNGPILAHCFDARFVNELFALARNNEGRRMQECLDQLNSKAMEQVCKTASALGPDSSSNTEKCERAGDMVQHFLGAIREPRNPEADTLLNVACCHSHLDIVRLLLLYKADPQAKGSMPTLHRAAQSGSLMCTLMVLDRLQVTCRSVNVSDFEDADGADLLTRSCAIGSADVVIPQDIKEALRVFSEMQNDARSRQLGSWHISGVENVLRGVGTGGVLSFVDLGTEPRSTSSSSAAGFLRYAIAGCRLAPRLFERLPDDDESQLNEIVEKACAGIKQAEKILLSEEWDTSDVSLDPAVRGFFVTANLRARWQELRAEATQATGFETNWPEDFWQTHFTAQAMVTTIRSAMGDTFQLLLTVLWLYTREAWLRHILDALAATLHASSHLLPAGGHAGGGADGATGATPSWPAHLPAALRILEPLVAALKPCFQLVHSCLCWFEEQGIRHSAVTYRPLQLPMLGLQKLVDKYVELRKQPGSEAPLGGGAWLALGAGSFFSSMSSRGEAMKRLTDTRCNALLVIRPDDFDPCFPKHMMLRGSNVDDTLFPLGALFRITRMSRTVSSELDPTATSRWPVMIIEVSSCSKFLEVLELLESRGDLEPGEAQRRLEEWISSAAPGEEFERLLSAGELLVRSDCLIEPHTGVESRRSNGRGKELTSSVSKHRFIWDLLTRAADLAEDHGDDAEGLNRALLSRAKGSRCDDGTFRDPDGQEIDFTSDGKHALDKLKELLGPRCAQAQEAWSQWRALGVNVPDQVR